MVAPSHETVRRHIFRVLPDAILEQLGQPAPQIGLIHVIPATGLEIGQKIVPMSRQRLLSGLPKLFGRNYASSFPFRFLDDFTKFCLGNLNVRNIQHDRPLMPIIGQRVMTVIAVRRYQLALDSPFALENVFLHKIIRCPFVY